MGILGFFGAWLKHNVPEVISDQRPEGISSLAIDMNALIHRVADEVYKPSTVTVPKRAEHGTQSALELRATFHNQLKQAILAMVKAIKPTDTLILAVDGTIPNPKLQQQRQRRFKSAKVVNAGFNRAEITPGTNFMRSLDAVLFNFINDSRIRYNLPTNVYYSSHLVPGEGEHKIMDMYRAGTVDKNNTIQGGHVIYSNDADLIILGLLSDVKDLTVYSVREETMNFSNRVRLSHNYVDIAALRNYLLARLGPNGILDFVLITMFVGNDFLPHHPSLPKANEAIEFLLAKYNSLAAENKTLVTLVATKPVIAWDNFRVYLKSLAMAEGQLLVQKLAVQYLVPFKTLQAAVTTQGLDPELFRTAWYNKIFLPQDLQFYEGILNQELQVTDLQIAELCNSYFVTMSWVMLYYTHGLMAVNHDWTYPQYYAPMFSDLAFNIYPDFILGYEASPTMLEFTVLHQLLSVLPLQYKQLLPKALRKLYEPDSILYPFLPTQFIEDTEAITHKDQGIPLIPMIDKTMVYDALYLVPLPAKTVNKYLPASLYSNILPVEERQVTRPVRTERARTPNTRGRGRSPNTRGASGRSPSGRGAGRGESLGRGAGRSVSGRGERLGRGASVSGRGESLGRGASVSGRGAGRSTSGRSSGRGRATGGRNIPLTSSTNKPTPANKTIPLKPLAQPTMLVQPPGVIQPKVPKWNEAEVLL